MSYNKFNNWIEIFKIKHTKWMFFLSLNSMLDNKLRKSSGDPQESSKIFVNLRRSSGQSILEQSERWSLFLVFKDVPGCIEDIPGHYGMFRGVPGCSEGVPGMFRAVLGVFRVCSRVFRMYSGVFRGVPGFTDTPVYMSYFIPGWLSSRCLVIYLWVFTWFGAKMCSPRDDFIPVFSTGMKSFRDEITHVNGAWIDVYGGWIGESTLFRHFLTTVPPFVKPFCWFRVWLEMFTFLKEFVDWKKQILARAIRIQKENWG